MPSLTTQSLCDSLTIYLVRCKKETISNLCGSKLLQLTTDAEWLIKEYKQQTKELCDSGGCYVDHHQAGPLHSLLDSLLAQY